MPTRAKWAATALINSMLCMTAVSVEAQSNAPLAAIDWLNQSQATDHLPGTILLEPPSAASATRPEVTVTTLGTLSNAIGLVSPTATGLPVDLWQGSDPGTLERLIRQVHVDHSPAMQSLLFTLLLSETRAPAHDKDQVLLARLDRLMELGAPDPAQALGQQAGSTHTQARFSRWFDATLLTGDEDLGCAALAAKPFLAPNYAARIFCSVRRGDWSTAALTLESAHALSLLPKTQLALLDRFLNPDIFENAPPLPRPRKVSPLVFRLYESIGEPLPTAPLPRAFAAADLRGVSGWKAQLEAAERLTHSGALNPNQLLGAYSERKAAASGGVWDRVVAVQRFETALNSKNCNDVARALPAAWSKMQQIGTEIAFADLFADPLIHTELSGAAQELAWRITLLSSSFERAARDLPSPTPENQFLAAIAQGLTPDEAPETPVAQAIVLGFSDLTAQLHVPPPLRTLIEQGQLGETILRAMVLFNQGAEGNGAALTQALATFRVIGLEDTARRAALQLLILKD